MTPLLAILLGGAVLAGVLSFVVTFLMTSARIDGAYNRARLLPGEIEGRLKTHRRLQTIAWVVIACLLAATGVVLHWLYAESISLDEGFWHDVLYTSLAVAGLAQAIGHPLIYILFLTFLIAASWIGVRIGVKLAARRFILTRKLPAVA